MGRAMLIDVNASFGGRETIQRFDVDTMRRQLERTPYSVAFVHCHQGASDASSANDQTLALCSGEPRWRAVGAIHPRDVFVWEAEIRRCLEAGIRLFRIFPEQGAWPVDSILGDQIVARLAGTGAALLIDATTPGLPTRLAERSAAHGVPLIFTEARYFPLTELIPLAKRYPNVYLETSRMTSPDGIEHCVATLGAGRLLYGSGTGRYPAAVSWHVLRRARISTEERERIAWRNAAMLLGIEPVPAHQPAPFDAVSEPAIDIHLHDKFPGAPFPPFAPEAYAAELARNNVLGGVSSSVTGIFYDLRQGNDENAGLISSVPNLLGYVVVDPRYPEDSARELQRLDRDRRFAGVKIHCSYARTLTSAPAMARLFELIAPYRKPVLIHNLGADWPEALVALANRHPQLPIIAAHAGYGDGPHPTHDAALRVAESPNIVIEFCSTYLATGAIRRGIEAVGMERVFFGSDFPLIALPYMRAAYEDAELTADEAICIYRTNAERLFPGLRTEN